MDALFFRTHVGGDCQKPCHPNANIVLLTKLWEAPPGARQRGDKLTALLLTQASAKETHDKAFGFICLFPGVLGRVNSEVILRPSFGFIRYYNLFSLLFNVYWFKSSYRSKPTYSCSQWSYLTHKWRLSELQGAERQMLTKLDRYNLQCPLSLPRWPMFICAPTRPTCGRRTHVGRDCQEPCHPNTNIVSANEALGSSTRGATQRRQINCSPTYRYGASDLNDRHLSELFSANVTSAIRLLSDCRIRRFSMLAKVVFQCVCYY